VIARKLSDQLQRILLIHSTMIGLPSTAFFTGEAIGMSAYHQLHTALRQRWIVVRQDQHVGSADGLRRSFSLWGCSAAATSDKLAVQRSLRVFYGWLVGR
jgi:hypothetical protein